MAVFVDDAFIRADVPNGDSTVRGVWCHMTADSTEELLAMAATIGLRKAWIQYPGTWKEHFDLTKSKRAAAVKAGAVEITWRDAARRARDARPRTQQQYPRVMVTGHRSMTSEQATFARAELSRVAVKLRDEHQAVEAISGMALGADQWWAQAALDAGLRLAAYLPFVEQARRWKSGEQRTWQSLLRQASRQEVVSTKTAGAAAFHARNDAMLGDCDLVVAVWDPRIETGGTASVVRKARVLGLDLVVVDLEQMRTRIEQDIWRLDPIVSFTGRNGFLSNFHVSDVVLDGKTYRSGEHAFNALKTADPEQRAHVASAPTPKEAKRRGRSVDLVDGWDDHVRYEVMERVVAAKFSNPDLRARLKATGSVELVEGNTWHDQHWGSCTCPRHAGEHGQNHLGLILMKERGTGPARGIEVTTGDLLADDADVLVNPVNTVGVMGKGLAKAFAQRWPEILDPYREACRSGELRPGGAWLFSPGKAGPWIVCAATKQHWRDPARLEWVRSAAKKTALLVAGLGAGSVAVPALGAGLGGLSWADVEPVLVAEMGRVDAVVRIYQPGRT